MRLCQSSVFDGELSYCKEVKSFLENTRIQNMFSVEFAKAFKIKMKELEKERRNEEIKEADDNLRHKGQMLM